MNILATPVHFDREDRVAWHFDQKGMFSVKSAYHVLEDDAETVRVWQRGESSRASNSKQVDSVWKKIWKLPRPPKMKQFLWRVAHNSLAFKQNISRRGVKLETRCQCAFVLMRMGDIAS